MKLHDEIGPEFAAAIDRQHARDHAACEPEAGPSGLRDTSGWLIALPGLGRRGVGPYTPCSRCAAGTFCVYGGRPLCLGCADAWGIR
jgi:hypothetical protein